ncbi:Uncharacterised protein [Mycobacteroides abscessus subsp. abscessus]|nr:Uncharacterised protein [Mycobacteroides abscessus subsp. abscessus]
MSQPGELMSFSGGRVCAATSMIGPAPGISASAQICRMANPWSS